LSVLPRLSRSVFIHAHDIRLPATFPLNELRDKHVYWTEQYLLMAYLIDNSRTRVQYGSTYHFLRNRQQLNAFMHGASMPAAAACGSRKRALPARDAFRRQARHRR